VVRAVEELVAVVVLDNLLTQHLFP
jgi:hypothetical protein